MRNNCIGLVDLLCAYADGELAKSDIQLVEDHLLICENCSAILKMYGEISSAVDDTNVPAPDALCLGVMNRIQNESVPSIPVKKKKWWHRRVILTRYAPVAACLVVGLLVWGIWGNFRELLPANNAPRGADMAVSEAGMYNADWAMPSSDEVDNGGSVDFEEGTSSQAEPAATPDYNNDDSPRRSLGSLGLNESSKEISAEPFIPLMIDEDSLNSVGMTYIISNESGTAIDFGDEFSLQVFVDGHWHDIIEKSEKYFNDILYKCEVGDVIKLEADWLQFYGDLPEGLYRLVKLINYTDMDKPAFYIAGEFFIR